jgi:hypothetical protein
MSEQEIKDIFSDEAYVSSLLALDTAEEVQASLAEKGLDLSTAEITKLLDTLQKYSEADGELSEDALETVTGGVISIIILAIVVGLFMAGAVGVSISAGTRRRW